MPGYRATVLSHAALAAALALAVFVIWLTTASHVNAGVTYFYVVPIGLVTWWWGRPAGVAAVLICTVLYLLGAAVHTIPHFGVALALRLAAFTGVVFVVSLLRDRVVALEHSAEDLEAITAALTPAALPRLSGIDASAAFVASDHGVSGDFYLLTSAPGGGAIAVVGDVTGHGPEAARLATFVRARVAALAAHTSDPAELLSLANAALVERSSAELVTATCLHFGLEDARLTWAVAGHPRPLRLPGMEELPVAGRTLPLGAARRLELVNGETSLTPEEAVLVYTDGAADVRRDGVALGAAGLADLLSPLSDLPSRELVRRAEEAILEWADGPLRDDLCLLAMRPVAAAGG